MGNIYLQRQAERLASLYLWQLSRKLGASSRKLQARGRNERDSLPDDGDPYRFQRLLLLAKEHGELADIISDMALDLHLSSEGPEDF